MAYLQGVSTSTSVWRNGAAHTVQKDGYEALLRVLVTHVAGKATLSNATYSGTGNGTIDDLDGGIAAPTETWTITIKVVTSTFTVSGSVSGAQADGTVGTPYTTSGDPKTSLINFLITAGGTAFVSGDQFTVDAAVTTTPAADRWVLDRWLPSGDLSDVDDALIWHGLGDATQAIHAGIRLHEDAGSSIWNWILRGYTGFSLDDDFENQPGINTSDFFMSLWDNDITYWITSNARRYIVVAKVSTRYFNCYQGLFLPFGSPNEYPYPYFVCANQNTEEAHNSGETKANWCGFTLGLWPPKFNGELRTLDGDWLKYENQSSLSFVNSWPNGTTLASQPGNIWAHNQNMPGGDHQLIPIMLISGGSSSQPLLDIPWGVLDGAMVVTGFNNSPETVLSISGTNWVCFSEHGFVLPGDFYALEMA